MSAAIDRCHLEPRQRGASSCGCGGAPAADTPRESPASIATARCVPVAVRINGHQSCTWLRCPPFELHHLANPNAAELSRRGVERQCGAPAGVLPRATLGQHHGERPAVRIDRANLPDRGADSGVRHRMTMQPSPVDGRHRGAAIAVAACHERQAQNDKRSVEAFHGRVIDPGDLRGHDMRAASVH